MTPFEKGNNAMLIGSYTSNGSVDISAKIQNYKNLTKDNFILSQIGGKSATASPKDTADWGSLSYAGVSASAPSITYDADTGVVTFELPSAEGQEYYGRAGEVYKISTVSVVLPCNLYFISL